MKRGWKFRQIARRYGADETGAGSWWDGAATPQPAGQAGPDDGQGSDGEKLSDFSGGQAGQGGQPIKTGADENQPSHAGPVRPAPLKGIVLPYPSSHGPPFCPDQIDQADQTSNGTAFIRSGYGAVSQTTLTERVFAAGGTTSIEAPWGKGQVRKTARFKQQAPPDDLANELRHQGWLVEIWPMVGSKP